MKYLQPTSQTLLDICSSVKKKIPLVSYRTRRPRPQDAETWSEMVDCIVCNLALVSKSGALLTVHTGSRRRPAAQRYIPAVLRSTLVKTLVHALEERGFIKVVFDEIASPTYIIPTKKFTALLSKDEIDFTDVKYDSREEVIILKHHHTILGKDGKKVKVKDKIDYVDTDDTQRMRAEVQRINALLESTDITMDQSAKVIDGPLRYTVRIDTGKRHLRRQFATFDGQPRWNLNGRLFGAFWESMDEAYRPELKINGERIADLDFASLHLNLLYHRKGVKPPAGDLYAIPGFEGHREGAKKIVNSIINTPNLRNWPDLDGKRGATRELFPAGTKLATVKAAIMKLHPILSTVEKETGFSLTFLESEIMMDALLTLADAGISALCMHDGLMCQQSKADIVKAVMGQAGERVAGVTLQVKRKVV